LEDIMKLYTGLSVALAATAIVGAALAAESDKFVVRGDASKAIMEQNSINIATAEAIGKACVDEATKEGVKISIVIYDQFGEPVYFYRMDGQGKANVDTAFMKARTALNVRAPSKTVMNQVLQGRSSELRQYSFGNFANSGGLPIIINGNQLIGAVGVGGSAPRLPAWSDEICAWRALTKVMGPQPPLLPDVQRSAAGAGGGAGGRGNGAPNQ
jgi:glc operon protein GlcG